MVKLVLVKLQTCKSICR